MAENTENKVEIVDLDHNDSIGTENIYEGYAAPVTINVSKEEYKPGNIDEMIGTPLPIPSEDKDEEDKNPTIPITPGEGDDME